MGETKRVVILSIMVALGVVVVVWDLSRPPLEQSSARWLLLTIRFHQQYLSPALAGVGVRCRFEPSCSRYADASIRRHGALGGSWRSVVRLVRCGPWTPEGTIDPP